ncbi:MAG: hypothetical protein DCC49_11455 [Acidobacteria bacterium]|nr:MAG: hypothetical protein DCC49_11455 [Acidobacteriota bacterium]
MTIHSLPAAPKVQRDDQLRWLVGADREIMARAATSFGVDTNVLGAISSVRAVAAVLAHYESRLWSLAGVSPAQGWLLMKLFLAGPARQTELAEDLMVTRSAISQLVSKLEQDRLVSRETSSDDRRSAVLNLTSRGNALITELLPTIRTTLAAAEKSLSSDGAAKMLEDLDKLRNGIEKSADLVFGDTELKSG